MRDIFLIVFLLWPPVAAAVQTPPKQEQKAFPYDYIIDDLPNGLRLVTVPTDYPNLVALYIVVSAGSRNEVDPGKSGYAHLFEHMMFRGSQSYTPDERDAILKRAGVSANASTWDDRTVYHEVFAKEDLDEIIKMEADRFLRLKYSPDVYRTETQAVLGEYNKNSADPFSGLYEKLRGTAFDKHTYNHAPIGFLKDIEDMRNQYDYSLEFYRRYYRPEYTTIVLVGDVTRERATKLVKQYFGDWRRGNYTPKIPAEPEQKAPRTAHVAWPSPTLPRLAIAFRGPAYSDQEKDKAALDLLAAIAFGKNSDLYQRLLLKEQKVDLLEVSFEHRMDPELFTVFARVRELKDVDDVRDQVLATFKRHTKELVPQEKLDATRSNLRYSAALAMNSSAAIASALAPFIALRRTPETINQLFALYQRISPEEILAAASRYFVDDRRTIVTLAHDREAKRPPSKEGENR
jgi:zinc protease